MSWSKLANTLDAADLRSGGGACCCGGCCAPCWGFWGGAPPGARWGCRGGGRPLSSPPGGHPAGRRGGALGLGPGGRTGWGSCGWGPPPPPPPPRGWWAAAACSGAASDTLDVGSCGATPGAQSGQKCSSAQACECYMHLLDAGSCGDILSAEWKAALQKRARKGAHLVRVQFWRETMITDVWQVWLCSCGKRHCAYLMHEHNRPGMSDMWHPWAHQKGTAPLRILSRTENF